VPQASSTPGQSLKLERTRRIGSRAGGTGGFTVLQFGQVPAIGLVHVAGPSGGICLDDPAASATYLRAFTRLESLALSPEASVRKIRQLSTRG
jgi:hypothetical protein